jgi:urate oxidase
MLLQVMEILVMIKSKTFSTPAVGSKLSSLSVDNFDNDDVMKVFPTINRISQCSNKKKYFGKVAYSRIDITGRQVYSSENEDFNGEKSIDLSDLNKGIYILKIKGDS